jgi:molybdopterin molybdotransferase
MNPLISPAEAEALILADLPALPNESVALEHADQRALAAPLTADRPLPPFDRVMMDGISFRSANASVAGARLRVHGLHAAGDPTPPPLPDHCCWEIMTGARLPDDCDTVVPYEQVERDGEDALLTQTPPSPGTHVHATGSDFDQGTELVPSGTLITARIAAVAATVGATSLSVTKKPRITILTTGDELVPPDQIPAPHQVRRSNDVALRSALRAWGPCDITLKHLPDSVELLTTALREALETSDLILSCGGISKGKRDHIRPVLEALVGPPLFHGISQRPGKPLAFWAGPPPIFALPGNPMSVLICFHRYVIPALHKMTGRPLPAHRAPLDQEFRFEPPLTYFLPVQLTPDHQVLPRPLQNSGDFASAVDSTGFIELPSDQTSFEPGTSLPYIPWL